MTFREAQGRLLVYIQDRIHNGEFTERGFARVLGISQPHLHNVLKGARRLSPAIFDTILRYFQLSILDLASAAEVAADLKGRSSREFTAEAAFRSAPVGPGQPWPEGIDRQRRFPLPFASPVVPPGYYMADLVADPAMLATLGSYRIALIDTSAEARRQILPRALYVVTHRGEALLRRVRQGAHHAYLLNDLNEDDPLRWEPVNFPAADPGLFVRARVRWLGLGAQGHGRADQWVRCL